MGSCRHGQRTTQEWEQEQCQGHQGGAGDDQQGLGDAAGGLGQPYIHKIETGALRGSEQTRRVIAAALEVPELLAFPAPLFEPGELERVMHDSTPACPSCRGTNTWVHHERGKAYCQDKRCEQRWFSYDARGRAVKGAA